VVVYLGGSYFPPQALALVLALVALTRRTGAFGVRIGPWSVACGLLLAALAFGFNNALPLKLYPVAVNASLLAIFGSSLKYPPCVAERVARIRVPDLPPPVVAYTRKVTWAWCVFFVANGLVALWTATRWPVQAWFYYNGIIAYLLVGVMFAGEWLVRRRVLAEYHW
jgi:uncharacterized membrane protein